MKLVLSVLSCHIVSCRRKNTSLCPPPLLPLTTRSAAPPSSQPPTCTALPADSTDPSLSHSLTHPPSPLCTETHNFQKDGRTDGRRFRPRSPRLKSRLCRALHGDPTHNRYIAAHPYMRPRNRRPRREVRGEETGWEKREGVEGEKGLFRQRTEDRW